MRTLDARDQLAVEAATDERKFEQLVRENELFILRCAASAARRYITISDDEWSVALLAFHQAVRDYAPERGSFFSFAELVIRRRITDYQRSEQRRQPEVLVNPAIFAGEIGEEREYSFQQEVLEKTVVSSDRTITQEIEAANELFSEYGFTFFDLSECSPKAGKTRKACAKAVASLLLDRELLEEMRKNHFLPRKKVDNQAGVPRKILERHRKYIIAAVEILSNDFPCLAEYMRWIREELDA